MTAKIDKKRFVIPAQAGIQKDILDCILGKVREGLTMFSLCVAFCMIGSALLIINRPDIKGWFLNANIMLALLWGG